MKTNTTELSLLEAQQRIHELIAQQTPLPVTLTAIADWIGSRIPGALVSIMRYDASNHTLSMVNSPNFSQNFINALQNIAVQADIGTCGAAAFLRQTVITENISQEPNWKNYLALAKHEGLNSCWSVPIITGDNDLLGTFATYYQQPNVPTADDLKHLSQGAGLACLALLRHRDALDHHVMSEWNRTLFSNHPAGVVTLDLDGQILSCNTSFETMTGFAQTQMTRQHFKKLVTPDDWDQAITGFQQACQGQSVRYEIRGVHQQGYHVDLEVHNFPVVINQNIVGVYGICSDVTHKKRQEAELRLLKRGTEVSPHGVVILDAQQKGYPAVYANPAFTKITQYAVTDILNQACPLLEGPATDPLSIAQIHQDLEQQNEVDIVLRCYRKDGVAFWNHLLIRPVFDANQACTHFLLLQQDISEQRHQHEHIQYQRTHDLGTGLPNQSQLYELLQKSYAKSVEGAATLAVLYVDMDDFQPINDELGHQVGDQVLAMIGQRILTHMHPDQMLARMVGDEFCILFPDYQHESEVKKLAKQVLECISVPVQLKDHRIHVSASIGIAHFNTAVHSPHELISQALKGVQLAKNQGRNTWQWYQASPLQRSSHGVTMRQEIHDALAQSQFALYYQPIINAKSGHVGSVEALVRWNHPKRGLVLPGEFISAAEKTGQIIPLGRWVLEQACLDIHRLNQQHGLNLCVAVNISSLQFYRDSFLDEVKAVLNRTQLLPTQLELEVTESVLLDGTEKVLDLMRSLQKIGTNISIDDFGTGFSSLSYLEDLPTQKLKLDRGFVQKVTLDQRTDAIVEAIVHMAHRLNMTVVAEGIETEQQKLELSSRGCDHLQGFLFAKPMPLSALCRYLC